jgi:hypothetical protein
VYILLLQLLDLGSSHLPPVGRQIAVCIGTDLVERFIGRGSQQRGEELLLGNGQSPLDILHGS